MADEQQLLRRVHGLGDLDLAALLCLVGREHCVVSTSPDALDALTRELRLVAERTFDLPSVLVDCTPRTTLDDLAAAIQLPLPPPPPPSSKPQSPLLSPAAAAATTTPRASPSPLLRRRGTDSSYFHARHGSHGTSHTLTAGTPAISPHTQTQQQPRIANVILARNLDRAPKDVQVQCLELLRTRRILTRSSVQAAPRQFLFVAVLARSPSSSDVGGGGGGVAASGLVPHLNDLFYVSHWHDPDDGFPHLEEEEDDYDDYDDEQQQQRSGFAGGYDRDDGETASLDSTSSIVRRSATSMPSPRPDNCKTDTHSLHPSLSASSASPTPISESDIAYLAQQARSVRVHVDVLRYQMNVVSFVRTHRAVAAGGGSATPAATRHLAQLARCLAALHGLAYVTPSLVALAARKVYPHRIRVVTSPDRERSVQWGSDRAAVEALLEGVGPDEVVDDVLAMVAAPL
ncbi:hypothetical protein GGR52DRAFT_586681 [Hypoxylon sp. FL1284]|nr:hypothetical protein GGR52DRAFT_586681 [Hypoxylon sp. FL1284]